LIFDMNLDGNGPLRIAKTLNKRKVPAWGGSKRKDRSNFWTHSAVNVILKSEAVFGRYNPPSGEPIDGLFPVVIDKEVFDRALAIRDRNNKVGRGVKGLNYTNLFSGLAKCHCCGGAMTIRLPRPGSARQLVCANWKIGKCKTKAWNYPMFEQAFLTFVNEINVRHIVNGGEGSRADELTKQLQGLEGQKLDTDSKMSKLTDLLLDDAMPADVVKPKLAALKIQSDTINKQIGELQAERNKMLSGELTTNEQTLTTFDHVPAENLFAVRQKTAAQIRTVVDSIHMHRIGHNGWAGYQPCLINRR
jgi:hypothetical protein